MSKNQLSISIMDLRKENEIHKENILKNKAQGIEDLEFATMKKIQEMKEDLGGFHEIKIILDSSTSKYRAIQN